MIKYLIIEDEKPAARRLQRMLEKEGLSNPVLLHSVQAASLWLKNNPSPDLIFADIHLSDGSFFDLHNLIESPVIFTTAFDQYAIKAFKLNSIDYLLKPIRQNELNFALKKYQNQKTNKILNLEKVLREINLQKKYKKRFTVTYGQHIQSIPDTQVTCFYSQDKISFLVRNDGETFICDRSLSQIEQQLDPENFMRINRKYIIRYDAIKDMLAYSNSRYKIVLKNFSASDIVVARERVKKFKDWISQ